MTDTPSEAADGPTTQESLLRRYKDGYRVATAIVTFGALVKLFGAFAAIAVAFAGAIVLRSNSAANLFGQNASGKIGAIVTGVAEGGLSVAEMLILAVPVALVFFFFWVIGVFISGQGQLIRATIDAAVNTSPFLTNDVRSRIMGL